VEKIEWSNELSVQVAEIDDQHKNLITMINELLDAKNKGKEENIISALISKLVDYIDYHFGTEETYMTRFNYSELTSHRNEHRDFIKQVLKFRRDHTEEKVSLSEDVLQFLADWFTNHIQGTDKGYSQCFVENGLK
jgi:hemerythrin